ncbi:MAG: dephospho-CoA kinase [Pseudomonadota bacterium]
MSLRVGLSGGIASGKSSVAKLFEFLGITVIDADRIARDVVLPGTPGLHGVVDLFGPDILTDDGQLNRKQLRDIIFSDPAEKERVDALLHPMIGSTLLQRSNSAPGPYHLLDIPLLVEGGWQEQLDRVLIVDCAVSTQIRRLCERDNETPESAKRIIDAQIDRQTRLAAADDVIDNNASIEALLPQVYALHRCYCALADVKNTE